MHIFAKNICCALFIYMQRKLLLIKIKMNFTITVISYTGTWSRFSFTFTHIISTKFKIFKLLSKTTKFIIPRIRDTEKKRQKESYKSFIVEFQSHNKSLVMRYIRDITITTIWLNFIEATQQS